MHSNLTVKSPLIRFVVGTLISLTVGIGGQLKLDASEKASKRALKETKTAADYKAIADCYYGKAAKARAQAQEHDEMAAWYRTAGEEIKKIPNTPGTIDHCERLVKEYTTVANDLTALAEEHEAMAADVSNCDGKENPGEFPQDC
jgi:hypothetical protein